MIVCLPEKAVWEMETGSQRPRRTRGAPGKSGRGRTSPSGLAERAGRLISQEISFVHSAEFQQNDADELILDDDLPNVALATAAYGAEPKGRVAPFFASLYRVRLLSAAEERDLFRRMNYLKYRANALRAHLCPDRPDACRVQLVEQLLAQASEARELLIHANLRLVVSIAHRFAMSRQRFEELVSEGNVTLINAIDKFNYTRGFRFSTYATHAVQRAFYRSCRRIKLQPAQLAAAEESLVDASAPVEVHEAEDIRPDCGQVLPLIGEHLDDREQYVLNARYGLLAGGRPATLREIGQQMGLSKERVRQLQLRALEKLQKTIGDSPYGSGESPD